MSARRWAALGRADGTGGGPARAGNTAGLTGPAGALRGPEPGDVDAEHVLRQVAREAGHLAALVHELEATARDGPLPPLR